MKVAHVNVSLCGLLLSCIGVSLHCLALLAYINFGVRCGTRGAPSNGLQAPSFELHPFSDPAICVLAFQPLTYFSNPIEHYTNPKMIRNKIDH